MQRIGQLLPLFQGEPKSKHEYEYQELCTELQPIYGKGIWALVHQAGVTEYKLREAHKIAVKRGITTLGYLRGIIKKLP